MMLLKCIKTVKIIRLIRNAIYFFILMLIIYLFKLYCNKLLLNQEKIATLFCIITTKQSNLDTKCKTSYETWVKECDGYAYLTIIPNNTKSKLFDHYPS